MPLGLFTTYTNQPYWYNKSASSIAKEAGVHPRTICRRAKVLQIPKGYLKPEDEERLKIRQEVKRKPRIKQVKVSDDSACPKLDKRLYSKNEYLKAKETITRLYEASNRKLLARSGYSEQEIEEYYKLPPKKIRMLPKVWNRIYKDKREVTNAS
jgi:hypothetical protein